jgi:hypothetical protein
MVPTGAFLIGHARIAARNQLMSRVDPAHAGRVFGAPTAVGRPPPSPRCCWSPS